MTIKTFILFDKMKDESIVNVVLGDDLDGLEVAKENRLRFYAACIFSASKGEANKGIESIEIKPCTIIIEE
jgi:hypothetical protein